MNLYQRPRSPYWYVDLPDYSVPKGRKRVSTKQRSKREAERVGAEMLTKLGTSTIGEVRETTIKEALEAYLATLRSKRMPSATGFESLMGKLLGTNAANRHKLDGARPVGSLTPADLHTLRVKRWEEGNAPSTTGNEIKALRSAVRAAVDSGARPPSITRWGVVEAKARERYLSPSEASAVFEHLAPHREGLRGRSALLGAPAGQARIDRQDAQDLFLTMLSTGCRWGEVASLTWSQVRMGQGKIIVTGKTGTREVPIVPSLLKVLVRRRQAVGHVLVFPGRGGRRGGPCKAIQHAMDAVGLNDPALVEHSGRACLHTLRHTYASWLRQRGAGLDEVQRLLGHTALKTTSRYAKVNADELGDRVGVAMQGLLPG